MGNGLNLYRNSFPTMLTIKSIHDTNSWVWKDYIVLAKCWIGILKLLDLDNSTQVIPTPSSRSFVLCYVLTAGELYPREIINKI